MRELVFQPQPRRDGPVPEEPAAESDEGIPF